MKSHDARRLRIKPVADEFRNRELAELAQIRRKQQGQQDVTPGPAHQVLRALKTEKRDQACHRDERCSRHPVGGSGHAVDNRVYALAGDIKVAGTDGTRPDRDADIDRERSADKEIG